MLRKDLLSKAKRIEIITNKIVDSVFSGQYHSVYKGRGIQFADFKEYVPGDDVRSIAWNVTAKQNKPFIKVFEEERELSVFFIIDLSSSNLYSSSLNKKSDTIAEIGAILSFSAIKNNDKVGMVCFSDKIKKYIKPNKGYKNVLKIITEMLSMEFSRGEKTNINLALDFCNKILKQKSIVFIISDFLTTDDISENIRRLSKKHDVLCLWVYDKKELELPNVGLIKVRDLETNKESIIDTSDLKFKNLYQYKVSEHFKRIKNLFSNSKVDHLTIENEDDYGKILLNYFKRRNKR